MPLIRRLAPFVACLLLAACALSSGTPVAPVTPAPVTSVPHRGPVLVQYCADDTGSYPRGLFGSANMAVANSLIQSVQPNSEGLVLYATLITSMTFDASNTLAPFVIPAIGNYPALPTPLPTPAEANPVSFSATATAVARQDSANVVAYNAAVAQVNTRLQVTKGQVTDDSKRLTGWEPAIDSTATSVWGCLQLARQRFAGQPGTKYLIIASDMDNNTDVDFTADFTASQALKGVIVNVIFYYCQQAGVCQDRANSWRQIFSGSGATSVVFDDPAQSQALGNLFGGA
jgi:hypothetical protein